MAEDRAWRDQSTSYQYIAAFTELCQALVA